MKLWCEAHNASPDMLLLLKLKIEEWLGESKSFDMIEKRLVTRASHLLFPHAPSLWIAHVEL